MRRFVLSALALSAVMTGSALGASSTLMKGRELDGLCRYKPMEAASYIQGIYEGLTIAYTINPDAKRGRACYPDRLTLGQINDVVCNTLRDNPSKLDDEASVITLFAFQKAFPCN